MCIVELIVTLFLLDGRTYRILVEEVDESDVGIIKFPSFNGDGGMEEYRYVNPIVIQTLKW